MNNTLQEDTLSSQTATITITWDGDTLKVTPTFDPPVDMDAPINPEKMNPVIALTMTAMMSIQKMMEMNQAGQQGDN